MRKWLTKRLSCTNNGGLDMVRIGPTGLRLSGSWMRLSPPQSAPEGKSVRREKRSEKRQRGKQGIILNDVPPERRLAYLLELTLERYRCKSSFWTLKKIVVGGIGGVLLLLVLWRLFT